jgi:hypothetical protein
MPVRDLAVVLASGVDHPDAAVWIDRELKVLFA